MDRRRSITTDTRTRTRAPGRGPRRRRLLAPVLAGLVAVAALPAAPPVRAAIDRATISLSTSYVLKASLAYATGTIAASETITIRNAARSAIDKINLSVMPRAFGELVSIGSFRVDGRATTGRWTNNANLELRLGRDVAPGETVRVSLRFTVRASGVIGTSLEGRLSKANGIMQVSDWFPIVSTGHPARYPGDSQYTRAARGIRLELTTDSPSIRIAAPGRRISGSGRFHVYEIEHARDFAFGASPAYRVISGWAAGVQVLAYYTTGNGSAALTYARSALATFESVYGQYQWPRFVIAQTGRPGSGNEYPGIAFLGGRLFGNRAVLAHETAHQWWYAMAGNDQIREPWLDEGLAEFSAAYFYGGFHPYVSSRPVNSASYEFPAIPAPETSDEPDSYDQTIYFKSARFLDGLRVRMGNAAFFGGLRAFFAANRNGVMTTREFYDTMAGRGAPTAYMRLFIRL